MVFICMHKAITTPINQNPTTAQEHHEVFIWMHTAAKIPHITKDKKNITGTYYGVELYASSSKNTTYNPELNDITGTSNYGVYLSAYSDNNVIYNQDYTTSQEHMVFICLHPAITAPINQRPKITTTGTYSGVYLYAYSDNNTQYNRNYNNITGTSNYGVSLYADSDNNPKKTRLHNITGTYYGVSLSASSSKNTTYNQDYTISQEQTMVFICMHTAATTNKKEKNPTKKQHHYTLKT